MAKIRLMFDPDRVTVGDLVEMEQGIESPIKLRDFLVRFLVNDKGEPIAGKKALDTINALTLSELLEAVDQFSATAQDQLVPPPQGGN